jgi:hypothetical protein
MIEVGQLCKISLDQDTIYKIIDVRPKTVNVISDEAQTIIKKIFVDAEELDNPKVKKINIPIYDIHIIEENK